MKTFQQFLTEIKDDFLQMTPAYQPQPNPQAIQGLWQEINQLLKSGEYSYVLYEITSLLGLIADHLEELNDPKLTAYHTLIENHTVPRPVKNPIPPAK